MKFSAVKDHGHTYKFYLNDGAFEYDSGWTFRLLRWLQDLHQSTWDYEILYADRYSKDRQL
jgi:hypothetical protein